MFFFSLNTILPAKYHKCLKNVLSLKDNLKTLK